MPVSAPLSSPSASAVGRRRASPGRFEEALRRAEVLRPALARPPCRHPTPPPAERPAEAVLAAGSGGPVVRQSAPPGISELQAAVRSAPPAIVTALAGGPAQLTLSLSDALYVELRAGTRGLELSLRPAPSLERAARAELPRLVEALRARGLRLARADVRGEGAARAPARAR